MDLPPLDMLPQAGAALAGVLLLAWGAARALRATRLAGRGGARRRLSLQESLSLDPRRRVVLLRCDGREALVLVGGAQDVLLGWLPTSVAFRE